MTINLSQIHQMIVMHQMIQMLPLSHRREELYQIELGNKNQRKNQHNNLKDPDQITDPKRIQKIKTK